jgi:hypothetical protein
MAESAALTFELAPSRITASAAIGQNLFMVFFICKDVLSVDLIMLENAARNMASAVLGNKQWKVSNLLQKDGGKPTETGAARVELML